MIYSEFSITIGNEIEMMGVGHNSENHNDYLIQIKNSLKR